MRWILGIDTAGPRGSVALVPFDDVGAEALSAPLPEGGHSSGLASAIERLLGARGLAVRDLAGIAVSEGPGSFTGLRIGLAWAKGAALGAGVPLALISAHAAAAHAARHAAVRFATVTQGERGHLLAALWQGKEDREMDSGGNGSDARLLSGPEAMPEDDLLDRLRAWAGVDVPIAAASEALEEWVLDLGGTLLPAAPLAPAIAALGAAAIASGRRVDLREAAPLYGRAPNARKPAAR